LTTYATSIPAATFPPASSFAPALRSTVKYRLFGLSTLTRLATVSLLRRYSVASYAPYALKLWKLISGGKGWKMGSSTGTAHCTLCVKSDMFRNSTISGLARKPVSMLGGLRSVSII